VAESVFVLSSHYEIFGVVIIASLALGVPVIVTSCVGLEDTVRSGYGILVPVDNVEVLAVVMVKMYNERALFDSEKIGANCHARYSSEVTAERLTQAYADVLSG